MIRVLLVDDHPVVRAGLRALVMADGEISVVGEASSGQEAISLFSSLVPDLTIMDLRLPDMDGSQAIRAIKGLDSRARILVFSTYGSEMDLANVLNAGAKGYFLKGASETNLIAAIRQVSQGQMYLSPELTEQLATASKTPALSHREMTILGLIGEGHSNEEIAKHMDLALSTVKTYVNRMLTKLGARDRTQALLIGVRKGLVILK